MKIKMADVVASLDEQQVSNEANKKETTKQLTHLQSQDAIESAVIETTKLLVEFLAEHQPQVTVLNPVPAPKSILTPDIDKVVKSLGELLVATKANAQDDTAVIAHLKQVAKELKALPRDIKFPEVPKPLDTVSVKNQIDYTAKFDELAESFSSIKYEPVIKVAATKVTVDTQPVADVVKELKDVIISAVSGIKMPESPSFDLKPLIQAVNASTKAINDRPVVKPPSTVTAYEIKKALTSKIDVASGTVTYIGECEPGTLVSEEGWRIKKITVTGAVTDIQWAEGTGEFDKAYDDRASYTYS